MAKICEICGKKPVFGHSISHAHNVINRKFNPNLQTVRANVNGTVKKIRVCTSCLKAGKVQKATKYKKPLSEAEVARKQETKSQEAKPQAAQPLTSPPPEAPTPPAE